MEQSKHTNSLSYSKHRHHSTRSIDKNDDQTQIQYWKSIKICGKMIEAKYLNWDKSDGHCDSYMVARLDNRADTETRTVTAENTTNPFWAEEFQFPGVRGYHDLKFVIYGERKGKQVSDQPDKPIGKVTFPRSSLKGEVEDWFSLENADFETSVSGDVRLRIKYLPAKGDRKHHGFVVSPVCARNLHRSSPDHTPNPFLAFHILPDKDATTTQQTLVQTETVNPTFSETFFFTFEHHEIKDRALHCSVWYERKDRVSSDEDDIFEFMGHVSIPLNPLLKCISVDKWYSLQPLAALPNSERKSKTRKKSTNEDERRLRPRDLVRSLHTQPPMSAPQARKLHTFVDQGYAFQACSHCNGVMIGNQAYCSTCNIGLHHRCKESASPYCGEYGIVKLRMKVVEHTVLPLQLYVNVLQLLEKEDFRLAFLLGRVSQDREEAAKNLLNIFSTKYCELEFLKCVARHEIEAATEAKTLFRANSMASKAIDVYMKQVASKHLKLVLEPRLQELISSGAHCEIDPSKLDKNEKAEFLIPRNVANLHVYNLKIMESIFAAVEDFPLALRQLFSYIQSLVIEKFPNDVEARYTCVSGFVFLRFFAPAILGPKLFGLQVGSIDPKASRALVLIAKVLQNLSNLVEFGQKESFMAPMNTFILENSLRMKSYIDQLCNMPKESSGVRNRGNQNNEVWSSLASEDPDTAANVARESAEIIGIISTIMDKMNAAEPQNPLIHSLDDAIQSIYQIQQGLKKSEDNVISDFGADVMRDTDPLIDTSVIGRLNGSSARSHVVRDDMNEYRMAAYLGRASTKNQSLIRTATELRDTMQRVAIQRRCSIVMSPITPITPYSPSLPSAIATSDRIITEIFQKVKMDDAVSHPNPSQLPVAIAAVEYMSSSTADASETHRPTQTSQSDSSLALAQTLVSSSLLNGGLSGHLGNNSPSAFMSEYGLQRVSSGGSRSSVLRASVIQRADSNSSVQGRGSVRQSGVFPRSKPPPLGLSGRGTEISSSMGALITSGSQQVQDDPTSPDSAGNSPQSHGLPVLRNKSRISKIVSGEKSGAEPSNNSSNSSINSTNNNSQGSGSTSRLGMPFSALGKLSHLRNSIQGLVDGRTSFLQTASSSSTNTGNSTVGDDYCKCDSDSKKSRKNRHKKHVVAAAASSGSVSDDDDDDKSDKGGEELLDLMTMLQTLEAPSDANYQKSSKRSITCSLCGKPKQSGQDDDAAEISTSSSTVQPRQSSHHQQSSTTTLSSIRASLMVPPISSRRRQKRDTSSTSTIIPGDAIVLPDISTLPPIPSASLTASAVCQRCELPLNGDTPALEANGKRYHVDCMTCLSCNVQLSDEAVVHEGDVMCKPCFLKETDMICKECGDFIESKYLVLNGFKYHTQCKHCGRCGMEMTSREYVSIGDQVFCMDHKETLITCAACEKRIDGHVLIAPLSPPRFYHPTHFCCNGCNKNLSETLFYEWGVDEKGISGHYCQPCFLGKCEADVNDMDAVDGRFSRINTSVVGRGSTSGIMVVNGHGIRQGVDLSTTSLIKGSNSHLVKAGGSDPMNGITGNAVAFSSKNLSLASLENADREGSNIAAGSSDEWVRDLGSKLGLAI